MESRARDAFVGEIAQARYDPDSEIDRHHAVTPIGYLAESDRELEARVKLLALQAEHQVAKYLDAIEAVAAAWTLTSRAEHRALSASQFKETLLGLIAMLVAAAMREGCLQFDSQADRLTAKTVHAGGNRAHQTSAVYCTMDTGVRPHSNFGSEGWGFKSLPARQ
jgi:hypothetical protein